MGASEQPTTARHPAEPAAGEIGATLSAPGIVASGPPGGIYANELFTDELGDATLFLPRDRRDPAGRASGADVAAREQTLP